ncbi:hypothetical protein [Mesorhizobium sp. A623]
MSHPNEDRDLDEAKRIMERLVKTPPDPGHKAHTSESDQKRKLGDTPAKKRRPEEDS